MGAIMLAAILVTAVRHVVGVPAPFRVARDAVTARGRNLGRGWGDQDAAAVGRARDLTDAPVLAVVSGGSGQARRTTVVVAKCEHR
ncbi:hypothetical protein N869_00515 [Cellulomonas bogoriensis 69B4 = DSM 16987]|uniref:Uncharacterized protein n=1 Tax=Cellulomonas bogoriensis 69B4 = DSM 16987 TaxID=1386082 RepID=A0A0A0BUM3_9CELL|nr:hypothetical protein N869_00515 [Cellulomonas bogoriensis 69B4 = DSM 16987]